MPRSTTLGVLLAAVALLAFSASASAFVPFDHSQITAPADPSFPFVPIDPPVPPTTTIEGTTSGGSGGNADIRCYWGSQSTSIVSNVTVTAGAFSVSVPTSALTSYPYGYCVLRAVPTGDNTPYPPGSATNFAGPRIGAGTFELTKFSGGSHDGLLHDFWIGQAQSEGSMDYDSLGSCGLSDSYVLDPITKDRSSRLFDCNGYLWNHNGYASGDANWDTATHSELRVDGNEAYLPGNADALFYPGVGSASLDGYPALTVERVVNPANADLQITETNPAVVCAPNPKAFHPDSADGAWNADCTSFASAGVTIDRNTVQDHEGRMATMVDTFRSTDGAKHEVELQFEEGVDGAGAGKPASLSYPWIGPSFVVAAHPQDIAGPAAAGPVTVFVDGNGPDPDAFADPFGAITYSQAPLDIHWRGVEPANGVGAALFHFKLTVPAGGAAVLKHAYYDASSLDSVRQQAAINQDALSGPVVSIDGDGTQSTAAAVTLHGTATDPGGAVTSFTLNGSPVAVASDGTWNLPTTLQQGPNKFTAVASDAHGNTASAVANIEFAPPLPVPVDQPAATPDRVAPTLGLSFGKVKLKALLAKGLPLTLRCSEPCSYSVGVSLGKQRVGTAKGKSNGRTAIRVSLNKRAKRALAKARKAKLVITFIGIDAAGNRSTVTKRLTVRR